MLGSASHVSTGANQQAILIFQYRSTRRWGCRITYACRPCGSGDATWVCMMEATRTPESVKLELTTFSSVTRASASASAPAPWCQFPTSLRGKWRRPWVHVVLLLFCSSLTKLECVVVVHNIFASTGVYHHKFSGRVCIS